MDTTVYENGRLVTLDARRPGAEALAVRGERIIAVGSTEDCREAAPGARRVDLGGRTVIPGLVDCHIHAAQYARGLAAVDLRDTRSLAEALDRVAAHARGLSGDAWVTGGRWDYHRWERPVVPDRRDLDGAVPDRPAALPSVDGHTTWVNTRALALMGVDRTTPDPVGGVIERDPSGEPTGILRESAGDLVRAASARQPVTDLAAQLKSAMTGLLSHGMTGLHDIDGTDALDAFRSLHASGELPLRVHKLLPASGLDDAIDAGWSTGDGDRWLRLGPVKLFADGALGSMSCLMSEPYGTPPTRGIAVTPPEALRDLVGRATGAGIAVATHAIGDAANRAVLGAYARAVAPSARPRLRMRIEHAQFLRSEDIPLFAGLNVIASMQPIHCTSDIALNDALLPPVPDRHLLRYAWSSLLRSGARVVFGSDAPVEDPNPWHGIHAAVTRTRPDGTPPSGWDPAERIDLAQAIASYTAGAAYASYEEHLKGRLSPGMLADFAVLGRDPFADDPASLFDMPVAATVVGGTMRWEAP